MKKIIYLILGTCASLFAVQCTQMQEDTIPESLKESNNYMELSGDKVYMSICASQGTKTVIGTDRSVSWNEGDTLYVVAPTGGCLGYLVAQESGSSVNFLGTIGAWTGTQDLQFYYLGAGRLNAGATTFSYDITSQSGTLTSIASRLQLMHGQITGLAAGTKELGALTMTSLIAVAKLDLLSQTGFSSASPVTCTTCATATLNLTSATFSGVSNGSITLNSPSANYYAAFIPSSLGFAFSQSGISIFFNASSALAANQFVTDSGNAIVVQGMPCCPGEFSVSPSKKVSFVKGNLYIDKSSSPYVWRIENNQYDYRNINGLTNDASIINGVSGTTPANTQGLFFYSNTQSVTYTIPYSDPSFVTGGVIFTNAAVDTPNPSFSFVYNGITNTGIYRTLTRDEWDYLYQREGKCEFATITVGGTSIKGLILLPDVWTLSSPVISHPATKDNYTYNTFTEAQWKTLEMAGAIFLPASNYAIFTDTSFTNYQIDMTGGYRGDYWSSNSFYQDIQPEGQKNVANYFHFAPVFVEAEKRYFGVTANYIQAGQAVRLVRDYVEVLPHYIVNGVDYGAGIRIGETIWAPVNCGTDATHTYGLLYQWGRKDGTGYTGETGIQTMVNSTVAAANEAPGSYYKGNPDWLTIKDDTRWNNAPVPNDASKRTIIAPTKTSFDPCPIGWRVPTYYELETLQGGKTSTTSQTGTGFYAGISGKYYNGTSTANSGVFLPFTGYRGYTSATEFTKRGNTGSYWSSTVSDTSDGYAYYLYNSTDGAVSMTKHSRAFGNPIRCVYDAN